MWGEDFLSGIQQSVESTVGGVTQSIGDFIGNSAQQALVKIGPAPSGNLSAQQIANGQTAGQPMVTPSSQPAGILARAGQLVGVQSSMVLPIAAAGAVLLFVLLKRRR